MIQRTSRKSPRFVLGSAAILGAVLLLAWVAQVQGQSGQEARVTEVREAQKGLGTSILINLGSSSGIRLGQTVEVRRDGKTIGYGSVDKVFSRLAVATIGTVVGGSGPLRAGDQVVFLDSGFRQAANRPAPRTSARPTSRPSAPARGQVVSVREGVVLVDFGRDAGLEVGHMVAILDAEGREIGRVAIELVGPKTGGGLLTSGEAQVGCGATTVGRAPGRESIDFVALDFLGVVADLEHPTPHRAPCHVGVPVRRVLAGSPALRAGIGRGDRVIAVDGIVVRDVAGIRKRIQARESDRVRVLVIRGDRLVTVDVDFSR
jgi:hypothetical protein